MEIILIVEDEKPISDLIWEYRGRAFLYLRHIADTFRPHVMQNAAKHPMSCAP